MKLELNGIRLIDSFKFMNFALAKFPATFGPQEMKKGYFPHWANTDEYWNYIGPYLDMSYYTTLIQCVKRVEPISYPGITIKFKGVKNSIFKRRWNCTVDLTLIF